MLGRNTDDSRAVVGQNFRLDILNMGTDAPEKGTAYKSSNNNDI